MHGGPALFLRLLADQLERRHRGDPPQLDGDPGWTVAVDALDPALERVHESLLTLADGRFGTRGAPLFTHPAADPEVFASGIYVGEGPETELARCPNWATLPGRLPVEPPLRRQLDLRTGCLRQDGPAAAFELASLARPGTVALRAAAPKLPRSGRHELQESGVTLTLADTRRDGLLERLGSYGSSSDVAAPRWPPRKAWDSSACSASTARRGRAAGRRPTS